LFGIETGDRLMNYLSDMFRFKNIDPDITLGDLYKKTQKRLIITTTCIGKGVRYFDYENAPNLKVLLAIRMSISMPFFFTAVKHEGDYYVDGGMLDNFPVVTLKNEPIDEVLTIRVDDETKTAAIINTFEDYLSGMLSTLMKEMSLLRNQYRKNQMMTIVVTAGPHKLSVTDKEKKELFGIGFVAAKHYLQSQQYLHFKINSLPFSLMRRVWMEKHRSLYSSVMHEMKKNLFNVINGANT
jgi:predicted acylesterase/phospholipase RssA